MKEAVRQRILAAGGRTAQVKQALYHEYGNITATEIIELLGFSFETLYNHAAKAGLTMRKGMRPLASGDDGDRAGAIERILNAGDRTSQAVQALYHEYGNITAKDAADLMGVSQRTMYNHAADAGLTMRIGLRPLLNKEVH